MRGAHFLGAVDARIEPGKHRHGEAIVVAVALGDDHPVLVDALDDAVQRARESLVRKPRPRLQPRRLPAGGEQGIAVAQIIGRPRAHPRRLARLAHDAAFGKTFVEKAHLLRRPAVVAQAPRLGKGSVGMQRHERVDHIRQMAVDPADPGRCFGIGGEGDILIVG